MDQVLIILTALAAAAACWSLAHVIATAAEGRRRKLHQRLSAETRSAPRSRSFRPILLQPQPTGLPQFLDRLAIVKSLETRVAQAFPETPVGRFLLIVGLAAGMPAAMVVLLSGSVAAAMIVGAIGGSIPFFVASSRRARRRRRVTEQLPEALDFLSRVLRSGQSLSTGLQMVADELPAPLSAEFRRCNDQHGLGQPLEDGLREMAERLESPDVSFFATAVIIQRQSGGDLAEVLKNISNTVRQRLRLQQSVKSKTAEGRFTGYVMVAFPAVMFCIAYALNREYGEMLLHTHDGNMLLGTAFGLQMIGLFAIRKITNVKV